MCFVISREKWHAIKFGSQEQVVVEVEAASSLVGDLSILLGTAVQAPKAPALTEQEPVMINPVVISPAPAPSPVNNLGSLKPEAPTPAPEAQTPTPALETENAPDDEGVGQPITVSEEESQEMLRVEEMLRAKAPVIPAKTKLTYEERLARVVEQSIRHAAPPKADTDRALEQAKQRAASTKADTDRAISQAS
jgi:hypothetical protein